MVWANFDFYVEFKAAGSVTKPFFLMIQIIDDKTAIISNSIISEKGYYIPLIKALLLLVRNSDLCGLNEDDLYVVIRFIDDIMPEDSQLDLSKIPRS